VAGAVCALRTKRDRRDCRVQAFVRNLPDAYIISYFQAAPLKHPKRAKYQQERLKQTKTPDQLGLA